MFFVKVPFGQALTVYKLSVWCALGVKKLRTLSNNINIAIGLHDKESYLLATIADTVITPQRAKSIFKTIGDECRKHNCQKVLLDEMTVEMREVKNHEIHSISGYFPDVQMAFLCKPELIDQASKLLGVFTFLNGYVMRHFCIKEEAIDWLMSPSKL